MRHTPPRRLSGQELLVATGRQPRVAGLGLALEVLRDTVAQFPTFSEAYLKGVERLDA